MLFRLLPCGLHRSIHVTLFDPGPGLGPDPDLTQININTH